METFRTKKDDGSWVIAATIRSQAWVCTLPTDKGEDEAKHLERTLHIDRLMDGETTLVGRMLLSPQWKQVVPSKVRDGL